MSNISHHVLTMNGPRNGCNDGNGDENQELHTLLSETVYDWTPIYKYILHHPQEVHQRYYRNESPLQQALKLRECRTSEHLLQGGDVGGQCSGRLHVLGALINVDPSLIHSRDEEGRTCLHTACQSGRSQKVLHWLIRAEERGRKSLRTCRNVPGPSGADTFQERNATLRTDYPGGALPLHLIAACPTFDTSCDTTPSDLGLRQTALLNGYPIESEITPHILSAYASTTVIRQAHPRAVFDRDCEGEIPLHAAASWGNVGSVLSLLIGAAAMEAEGSMMTPGSSSTAAEPARAAALAADDRKKTPLDRACERLCSQCVHVRKPPSRRDDTSSYSLRQSIARDDPFESSLFGNSSMASSLNRGRQSSLLINSRVGSVGSRIPGRRSSLRCSFSNSFLGCKAGGPHLDIGEDDEGADGQYNTHLRAGFISSRRPVHPTLGLAPLDCDGVEEFAKVEMLSRAACGLFDLEGIPSCGFSRGSQVRKSANSFRMLHAVIALRCPPEIVWHAAAAHPHQVMEMDESGRTPMHLACERLVSLYQRLRHFTAKQRLIHTKRKSTNTFTLEKPASTLLDEDNAEDSIANQQEDCASDIEIAARKFVQSFLIGGNFPLLDGKIYDPTLHQQEPAPSHQLPSRPHSLTELSRSSEPRSSPSPILEDDDSLQQSISLSLEIINVLLHSPQFGQPRMASVPNSEGQLALHIVLEAGAQWAGEDNGVFNGRGSGSGHHEVHVGNEGGYDMNSVIQTLVHACPQALETKDTKSGLFPFMISATQKAKAADDDDDDVAPDTEEEDDEFSAEQQLETVYQLLLKAPNVVSLCALRPRK